MKDKHEREEREVHVQQRRRTGEKRDVRWLTEEVKERLRK